MPDPDELVSPELVAQFNRAAALARENRLLESLAAWERLLGPQPQSDPPLVASGRFLGVARMRMAWVLMDLGRYPEARRVLEEDVMQAMLGQLGPDDLFEYFFSYGNTLGELREVEAMDHALSRALAIAAEELGDVTRCENAYRNLVDYGCEAGAWEYLLEQCPSAIEFAKNYDLFRLELRARFVLCLALKETAQSGEARAEGQRLLADLARLGAEDMAPLVRELLDSLGSNGDR